MLHSVTMNTRVTNFTSNNLETAPIRLSENTENLKCTFTATYPRRLNIINTLQKKITPYGKGSLKFSQAFHLHCSDFKTHLSSVKGVSFVAFS